MPADTPLFPTVSLLIGGILVSLKGARVKKKKMVISQETMDVDFVRKVEALSGTSVRRCFQCGKCSAGCPMATFMEHPPNRVVRLLQLGQWQRILAGRSIWYCASCETCSTRCPNKVHLASIMDALRKLSWDAEGASKESYVQLANKLFLQNIRTYGRQYEMRLAAVFNVKSGQFLKDLMLGPKLLAKGKLKMFHSKNRNMNEIEKIFSRIDEMRKKGEAL
jgi:heterodisulfide reductase subunit C